MARRRIEPIRGDRLRMIQGAANPLAAFEARNPADLEWGPDGKPVNPSKHLAKLIRRLSRNRKLAREEGC